MHRVDENLLNMQVREQWICVQNVGCITRLRFFKAVIIQSQKLLLYYVWYSKVGKQQLGKITPWGQCRPPHGTVEKGAFSKMQRQCALFPIFQVVSEKNIVYWRHNALPTKTNGPIRQSNCPTLNSIVPTCQCHLTNLLAIKQKKIEDREEYCQYVANCTQYIDINWKQMCLSTLHINMGRIQFQMSHQ